MLSEKVLKEYRLFVRLSLNIYNRYTFNRGWLLSLFTTYLATAIAILLLTSTIGIVNKGIILTDEQDERKHLEKKFNDL